jgi:hypothetical protein
MPFIGNQPALSYTSFAKQDFTTSATTSYTLDNPVANANELALFINFVRQEPTTAYSASGTSLTLTSATSASDDMYCVYLGKAVQTVNPPNVILQDDSNGQGAYIKEWNLDIAKPTDAQLDALETQAQTYENNQQIISTRKSLYGSWESQLEEIYDDGIDNWKARIQQIKTDNPKETE